MAQEKEAFPRRLILNFSDLIYLDSAGLGLLTLAHRKLSNMSYNLVITNAQGQRIRYPSVNHHGKNVPFI